MENYRDKIWAVIQQHGIVLDANERRALWHGLGAAVSADERRRVLGVLVQRRTLRRSVRRALWDVAS